MSSNNNFKMCLKILSYFIFVSVLLDFSNGQKEKRFFRKDYTYIENTGAFYKFQTLRKTWYEAKKTCDREGATFFYPENDAEAKAVIKLWNSTHFPVNWAYIGMSDLVAKGVYETVDGKLTADVYNNWNPGEPNDSGGQEDCVVLHRINGKLNDDRCSAKFPFICKKTLQSLDWNHKCNLPDLNYIFNEQLGRCYKIHKTPLNWTEAYTVCRLEQSYLAVINSDQEAQYLVDLVGSSQTDKIKGVYTKDSIYLGFRNIANEGWQTFRGDPLEDSGYTKWAEQKTDGIDQCGSMLTSNGYLNQISCGRRCLFVCEHDIQTPITSLSSDTGATLARTN